MALGPEDDRRLMVLDGPKSRMGRGDNPTRGTIPVRVMTLPGLMRAYDLSSIDLLKLDCEGAEWGILQGADPVIDRVSQIALEYHLTGEWSLEMLTGWLQERGFRVYTQGRGWLGLLWATRLEPEK